jgi:hypothetical protein
MTRGQVRAETRALVRVARRRLGRAVESGWARGTLSRSDAVLSSMLDARDIEQLLSTLAAEEAVDESGGGEAAGGAPEPSAAPPLDWPSGGRLAALMRATGAGPLAGQLVQIAIGVELDETCRTLAAYLRGGTTGVGLTVSLLMSVVGEVHASEVLVALGAGAPLRRHRLVEVVDKAAELGASATVRAAPRLVRWLVEGAGLDDEVAEFATLYWPSAEPQLTPAALVALEQLVDETQTFLSNQRRLVAETGRSLTDLTLRGPRGSGRAELAVEAARRLGVPLIRADVGALAGQPSPAEAAAALLRETVLLDAQLLLTSAESLNSADESIARLRMTLGTSAAPLLLTSSGDEQVRLAAGRSMVLRDVRIVSAHTRKAIWAELLPEVPSEEVASLYRVGVGAIGRSALGARLRATVRHSGRAALRDVQEAVRAEFETDLGTVATRVDVSQTWDDLVVPDETGRTVAELVDQLRHRATVLGRWGFSRKLGKGLGTTALFSGEPGTGKSMVAGLIAKELGLELYQIDLSRVISKWIGETEKNLAKVFDAAETGHVVLLFDEADALLGKRTTDVKNANDRFANIETNYILQRLEAFHGVAILTSNLQSAIDPALARRLSFELRFPFPDEEQRAEIWRRMLPEELPTVGAIDYELLARRFELSGGYIRNIVLRAAYLAAAEAGESLDGAGLSMAHLLRAAESEYRDHGMLVAQGRLKT